MFVQGIGGFRAQREHRELMAKLNELVSQVMRLVRCAAAVIAGKRASRHCNVQQRGGGHVIPAATAIATSEAASWQPLQAERVSDGA